MYTYELNDLMFFIKTLKFPSTHFDISEYLQFVDHNTRAASTHKLSHHRIKSSSYHTSYFNRIIQLWNSIPVIDLTLSLDTIKTQIINYLWVKFDTNFISESPCTFPYSVHVIDVQSILSSQIFNLYQTLDLVDNLFIISR